LLSQPTCPASRIKRKSLQQLFFKEQMENFVKHFNVIANEKMVNLKKRIDADPNKH
jgi:hypothetical protein